ncbi:hypothetical protein Tco_0367983 [Tanacetum coccineum]
MNQVLNENERLLEQVISKDIVNTSVNSSVNFAFVNVHECEKCLKLETELLNKKDFVEKEIYDKLFKSFTTLEKHCISLEVDIQQYINFQGDNSVQIKCSKREKVLEFTALKDDLRKPKGKALVDDAVTKHSIDPEMLKIDVKPITPKLLNKKTAHSAYTQEEAKVLRDLVEHVKSKYSLDHSLESACRYAKLIQELLTHISKTCSSINNTDGKLVAVTLKNKDKRVRFTKPVTSSGNTITKIASTSNLVSNKPMLSSTGVKLSTSASGSQPSGNTKKDKIRQTPSSTQKNKVEAPHRESLFCLKNKDVLLNYKRTAHMQLSETYEFSKLKGVNWKPRKSKTNVPVSKSKVLKVVSANKKEPIQSWGSIVSDVPSTSLDDCRSSKLFSGTVKFGNDHVAKILGYGDYQIGNVTISRVYYVEELGHNLFSVGQF